MSLFFVFIFATGIAKSNNFSESSKTKLIQIEVVELTDYSFTADSFFEDRKNVTFKEKPADPKFQKWALEAIDKVNQLIPKDDQLQSLKLKLIFQANIQTSYGLISAVPVSIIDSYQEPKTLSIRLGMLELKDDEITFKITVAHEYSHLVFENASRKSGKTNANAEVMTSWSKPIYEGAADLMASLALNTHYTGGLDCWATRDLFEFENLEEAQNAKDATITKARKAFQMMGLVPKFKIYENWLELVEKFIQSSGNKDPYAEGSWFAGGLLRIADTHQKKMNLVRELIYEAKSGHVEDSTLHFYNKLKSRIEK